MRLLPHGKYAYTIYERNDFKMKDNESKNRERLNIPIWQKINLTVEEAAAYSNIGINKLRSLADEPSCPFVLNIGKRRVIKRREFERYLEKVNEV